MQLSFMLLVNIVLLNCMYPKLDCAAIWAQRTLPICRPFHCLASGPCGACLGDRQCACLGLPAIPFRSGVCRWSRVHMFFCRESFRGFNSALGHLCMTQILIKAGRSRWKCQERRIQQWKPSIHGDSSGDGSIVESEMVARIESLDWNMAEARSNEATKHVMFMKNMFHQHLLICSKYHVRLWVGKNVLLRLLQIDEYIYN